MKLRHKFEHKAQVWTPVGGDWVNYEDFFFQAILSPGCDHPGGVVPFFIFLKKNFRVLKSSPTGRANRPLNFCLLFLPFCASCPYWLWVGINSSSVDDFTHAPPETLAVLETPGVEDAFSRAKKKPCLDDRRDKNPKPLDKDRDTICRVLKSNPQGPAVSRRTNKLLVF
mgnify:CR=1 FL=1